MIASIKSKWLRRTAVVLTILALLLCMLPLWALEAIWRKVRREFGEDIDAAWRGEVRK
jgi:hypothetical protein